MCEGALYNFESDTPIAYCTNNRAVCSTIAEFIVNQGEVVRARFSPVFVNSATLSENSSEKYCGAAYRHNYIGVVEFVENGFSFCKKS